MRKQTINSAAYIFDIGAGVDGNHVTVFHPEVVADDSVDSGAAIIKIVVGENDQNGILPLLASNKHCVAAE